MKIETETADARGQAQEGAREPVPVPAQEIFIISNPFSQNRTLETYLFHLADLASSRRNLRRRKVAI
jgi:hypothetical protein